MEESGLNQAEASRAVGIPQPKISAIHNYELHGISLERLMYVSTSNSFDGIPAGFDQVQ